MQIQQGTGNDLRGKKIDQQIVHVSESSTKPRSGWEETWRLEDESEEDAVRRRVYSTCTSSALPRELLKRWETSKWEDK